MIHPTAIVSPDAKIGKNVEGISAVDVLEDYKDLDPVRAVATFISDRIGRDLLSKIYNDQTAEELYHAALQFADAHFSEYYARFQALVVNLSDADYQPANEYLQLLQSLIPEKIRSGFLNHSLTDVYRGESLFSAETNQVDFSLDRVSNAIVRRLGRILALDDDTEAAFIDALNSLKGKLTILMVAHRAASIRCCDRQVEIRSAD